MIEFLKGKITIKHNKHGSFGRRKLKRIAFLWIQKKSIEQIKESIIYF
jgi:hypothetical protein